MAEPIAITATGLKKFKDELQVLQEVTIPEIKTALKRARENGDLSENADYSAAREALAEATSREIRLKAVIENAVVIDDWDVSTDSVRLGVIVEIENQDTGKVRTIKIVGQEEFGKTDEMIYVTSDTLIVSALLDHKIGDVVEVNAPVGIVRQKILSITNEKQRAKKSKKS